MKAFLHWLAVLTLVSSGFVQAWGKEIVENDCEAQLSRPATVKLPENFPKSVRDYIAANPQYTARLMDKYSDPTEAYFKGRVARDYEIVSPSLPDSARAILDIGSGIGGIDALLAQRYPSSELTLIDKNERVNNGQPFHVLEAARALMEANGLDSSRFHFVPIENVEQQAGKHQYDLVVSLRALGYTFPFVTYLSFLRENLKCGGTLIFDVATWDIPKEKRDALYNKLYEGNPHSAASVLNLLTEFGRLEILRKMPNSIRVKVVRECR